MQTYVRVPLSAEGKQRLRNDADVGRLAPSPRRNESHPPRTPGLAAIVQVHRERSAGTSARSRLRSASSRWADSTSDSISPTCARVGLVKTWL